MNRARGIVTTVALAGALAAVAPAGVAQAGNCVNASAGICGKVYNDGGQPLGIIHNWGEGTGAILNPGQTSTAIGWRDTDGFTVRSGWCGEVRYWNASQGAWQLINRVGAGAHQIHDAGDYYHIRTWDC